MKYDTNSYALFEVLRTKICKCINKRLILLKPLCDEIGENNNNDSNKPRFVGNDYTCNKLDYLCMNQQQCGTDSSWFLKILTPTTADITVRICRDQASSDKDIALTELEIYIQ